jgi:arabinofuranosyltransferase
MISSLAVRRYVGFLLLICGATAGFVWLHGKGGIAVDDGFIVLRYAAHFVDGQGLVYNAGERVEGFSSPLWMALLAGLESLVRIARAPDPARLEFLNRALGIVSAAGSVVATFALVRARFRLPPVYQLGAAAGVLLSWPMIFWSGAGLDAPLFALLVVLTGNRLLGAEPFAAERRRWTTALLTALAICRPEGPLFVATAGVASVALVKGGERRDTLRALGRVGLGYAALLAVRFAYYGQLLPNTYYAKVGGGPFVILRGGFYLYDYLTRAGGWGLGVLAALGAFSRRRNALPQGGTHVPMLALLVTGIGFVLAVGGDGLYCFRFVTHFLPLLCAYAACGAYALEKRLTSTARLARGAPSVAGAILGGAVYLGFVPFVEDEDLLPGVRNSLIRESEDTWSELGRALHRSLPPDALLATNIAGKVPYESKLPTLDLLGLTDPVIAKTKVKTMGRGYAGHEKANVEYVAGRRPAVLFISVLERTSFETVSDSKASGLVLAATTLGAYAPLVADETFAHGYRPAQVFLRSGFVVPLYLRRDLADRLRPSNTLRIAEWRTDEGL